jgi:hypothetical protein
VHIRDSLSLPVQKAKRFANALNSAIGMPKTDIENKELTPDSGRVELQKLATKALCEVALFL